MTTYGYKAMNMDMICRKFQFEVGKTYKIENDKPLKSCTDSGFHFCKHFEDVFCYYDWFACRVFKVKTDSEAILDGDKYITKEITILDEVTRDDLDYKYLLLKAAKRYYEIMLESDEKLIFNKYKDRDNYDLISAIVNRLTDEKLIFNTFKGDIDSDVRTAVVAKLTDEKLIFDTFKDDEDYEVRKAVVEKLTDPKFIAAFEDDTSRGVRENAKIKLNNLK